MKRRNWFRKNLYGIIKFILIFSAIALIANSVAAILLVPFNVGSILPGMIGSVIIGCYVFEKGFLKLLRSKVGGIIGWVCGILVGLNIVLFLGMVSLTLIQSAASPDYEADAVIVLGAGLAGDRVTITLAARLDKALWYFQKNPNATIVVSGGQGPNETISEAGAMAKYLIERGVPDEKIIREPRSSNTEENFEFSKALLNSAFHGSPIRILYITNRFHIFRAGLYAGKAGLNAKGLAAPTRPLYLIPNNYSREYFALIKYLLFRR
ncbi:MAG: YdcF family protein [Clostridiales bacterium]|nr:YdcF family protein [Clostridiales bacterium]